MNPTTPVACSLSADELPSRLAEIRAVGKDALLSTSSDGALHFRADKTTRGRLRWTPLSSARLGVWWLGCLVMVAWLGWGGRRDDNDDTSL